MRPHSDPSDTLFTPLRLGALALPHRILMAPLTRMRAGPGGVPTVLNAEYYAQRAAAALIFTEDTAVSRQAQGYPDVPGVFTPEQIEGWGGVAAEVHARGGRIVMQIAHNGRNSHSSYMTDGSLPVAPSAIPPEGQARTPTFQAVPYETPRALEASELPGIVESFRRAALSAMEAGFDGVCVQGANGHLLEQFLEDGTNRRTDAYGGSVENRARLLLEVVDAVGGAVGLDRLGVRLSPHGQFGGIRDGDPVGLFSHVITQLSRRQIAYLHLIEALGSEIGLSDDLHVGAVNNAALFRPLFAGPLISAGAYTPANAAAVVGEGRADAVAFGRSFLANPDLPERIRLNASLNQPVRATFYGGGAHGYTDYPSLGEGERDRMNDSTQEHNKALVREAFETLFNKRDFTGAERYWSPDYIQHNPNFEPGRAGLFDLIRALPPTAKYESGVIAADGDFVMMHGRYSGIGLPADWIAVDIVRLKDGVMVEHWDVIQDEATREQSKSGHPMFGDSFPRRKEPG